MSISHHPSSYRDPAGFLFYSEGVLYRQVNVSYKEDYDLLNSSGLYQHLLQRRLIVPHQEVEINLTQTTQWYKTLQPELLPFISYPCEWSFDMLKDAALLTLDLTAEAMRFGMMMKDASAYNLQWHEGRMTLIDTLSFEKYDATKPWVAYRQFCEQFYAPLTLMHYTKTAMPQLLLAYPEGVPLAVASGLLPFRSKWNLNTYLHIHLQQKLETKAGPGGEKKNFTATKLKNILRGLKESIQSFNLQNRSGVWSGYYEEAANRHDYLAIKKAVIENWVYKLPVKRAVDLGANEGEFSELLWKKNIFTISSDFDHYSINRLYHRAKKEAINNVQPLVIDLSNPTPAFGVNNVERSSFISRCQTDLVMALALIHHLAIGKNMPFSTIADLFRKLGRYLLIEFVPKEDEKIRIMLQHRADVFPEYNIEQFLKEFTKHYRLLDQKELGNSGRTLFLMQLHEA